MRQPAPGHLGAESHRSGQPVRSSGAKAQPGQLRSVWPSLHYHHFSSNAEQFIKGTVSEMETVFRIRKDPYHLSGSGSVPPGV